MKALPSRRGFTLIEVLAIALLIGTGMLVLVGVILWGLGRALAAQAACTALPTAITAAYDPRPLLPDETAADWTAQTVDRRSAAAGTAITSGWLNGYWVVREESSAAEDVLGARQPAGTTWTVTPGGARTVHVAVHVYEGSANGKQVAAFTTRILAQAAP